MTTTTPRPMTSTHGGRILSLARGEIIQLLRNKTLVYTTISPIFMLLALYFMKDDTAIVAGVFSFILCFTLVMSTFYPLLAMTATRRDEKVLKRLRVGEATDGDILLALSVGSVLSSTAILIVCFAALPVMGFPLPDKPVLFLLTIILGILLACALAFITSIFTRNAEAAQMTYLPVFFLSFLSLKGARSFYPDAVSQALEYTPFVALYDLIELSWSAEAGYIQPFLVLCAWTAASCWAGITFMTWDNSR